MSQKEPTNFGVGRREFLRGCAKVATAAAVASLTAPSKTLAAFATSAQQGDPFVTTQQRDRWFSLLKKRVCLV